MYLFKALHVDVRRVFIYFINVIVTTVTCTCHLVKLLVWTTRMPGVRPSKGAYKGTPNQRDTLEVLNTDTVLSKVSIRKALSN